VPAKDFWSVLVYDSLIPSLTDQNPCAQSRNPMDMIRQG